MKAKAALTFADVHLPLDRPFAAKQPYVLVTESGSPSIRAIRCEISSEKITDPVYIKVRIGHDDATVKLSDNALALFCQRREPGLEWGNVDGAIKPLILECILQVFLAKLEELCGAAIEIIDIVDDASGYATNFACEISVDGLAFIVGFNFSRNWLNKLHLWQATLPAALPPDVPVSINIRRGAVSLSRDELRSLRIGDAIVLDVSSDPARIWAVTAERFLSEVCEEKDGFRLLSPLLSTPPSSMRYMMSSEGEESQPFQATASNVGDIPIRLVVDAGRIEVALSELEGIDVGHVFNIGRHPARAVEIVAQGRIIGQGEIVSVEGLTAVRVTALNT